MISMNKLKLKEEKMYPYVERGKNDGSYIDFYEFEEHREYVNRKVDKGRASTDVIQDYDFIFNDKGTHVGIAQRTSQQIDIYYDGILIDETKA